MNFKIAVKRGIIYLIWIILYVDGDDMKISRKDVEHVALLSRLELEDQEVEKFTGQLNAILEHVEVLNKADTENVEPTAHVLP